LLDHFPRIAPEIASDLRFSLKDWPMFSTYEEDGFTQVQSPEEKPNGMHVSPWKQGERTPFRRKLEMAGDAVLVDPGNDDPATTPGGPASHQAHDEAR
jgi:hypothetical protein